MRRLTILIVCLMAPAGTTISAGELLVDAGRGAVSVRIPSGYDPERPTALVILLHGYTSSGAETEALLNLSSLVDEYGFLYAFPDGTTDLLGNGFWNATDACCNVFGSGVDDVGYIVALIDEVRAQLNVDPWSVFLLGHSNGGFMSYRMACDEADVIAALVSMAGATFSDPADCNPVGPVNVLQIHGTSDETIAYSGGAILGTIYPSAVQSVESWAVNDGCSLLADSSSPPLDLDTGIPDAETTVSRYNVGCDAGGSAELWTIAGGSHVPAISDGFRRGAIEFLQSHRKAGLVFSDKQTVGWPQVHWATRYKLYRGSLSDLVDGNGDGLPDAGYGDCTDGIDPHVGDTLLVDPELPPPGAGFFYVMGFEDVDGQDSVLGITSAGLGRVALNSCP